MKETIILLLIFFACYPFSFRLVKRFKESNGAIWLFSVLTGLTTTIVVLFVLNQAGAIMPAQNQVIDVISEIDIKRGTANDRQSFLDNFVFVDNSFSNKLIPAPESNQKSTSTICITDRSELAELFDSLQRVSNLVDLIICDIYFDLPSQSDSMLRSLMAFDSFEGKLLLSYNNVNPNTRPFASLEDSIYGNIVELGQNDFFATYRPYTDNRYSLAYLMAQRIGKFSSAPVVSNLMLREKGSSGTRYGLNCFLPKFDFKQEKEVLDPDGSRDETHTGMPNYFELGEILNGSGTENLEAVLKQRKVHNRKNYIFIGSLKSKSDRHDTYFGKLQGPIILLNLCWAILSGQHILSIWFVAFLWAGFSYILVILIKIALQIPFYYPFVLRRKAKRIGITPRKYSKQQNVSALRYFLNGLKSAFHLVFVEELHLWLVVILVVCAVIVYEGGWDELFGEISFYKKFPAGARKDATYQSIYFLGNNPANAVDYTGLVKKHPYFLKYRETKLLMNPVNHKNADWWSSATMYIIRYPEVLLTYAESKAMSSTPDASAYSAINQVRKRAGLPDLMPGLSQAAFRDSVIAERSWEFAGPEPAQRWFDLIRTESVAKAAANRDASEVPLNKMPDDATHTFYWAPLPAVR